MKLDYLLRMQKRFAGQYGISFGEYYYLENPFPFFLGKNKLTKDGRKEFADALQVEVKRDEGYAGARLVFEFPDYDTAAKTSRLLWLLAGYGGIDERKKYITPA